MKKRPTLQSPLSEEDTKRVHITPALEKKWDQSLIRMEQVFTDGAVLVQRGSIARGKRKKADYILYLQANIPLAVVEAKSIDCTVGHGMQQALEYAEMLDIPFAYSSNGKGFLEHDRHTGLERELEMHEFPTSEELWHRYKTQTKMPAQIEQVVRQPYYFQQGDNTPRYYQRIAINRAVEAIAKGRNRLLLVMATGTGKTYTAFQIIHRLWKAGTKKKVLFLADRNILIDQTIAQDFRPFKGSMTKVENRKLDSAYEIYLGLYQQLSGDEGDEPYKAFSADFFDLIVIDECHRGSARDDSNWRRILDYFDSATQLGMTATPKESTEASNHSYFGDPIYTYSLKQGISDGFLAPYRVLRVGLDKDLLGYRPEKGKKDVDGELVEDRIYNTKDFDRNLIIDERTLAVADHITQFLKNNGRYDKTIVFCENIDHAERMRQALVNANADLGAETEKYVRRITGDSPTAIIDLDNFSSVDEPYPVIATTSQLMRTGVDCKTCKLIVLDVTIESMTEFKQIIGRGTRLRWDDGKKFFTIMDFRGATEKFADPEFNGVPMPLPGYDELDSESLPKVGEAEPGFTDSDSPDLPDSLEPTNGRRVVRIRGVDIMVINEITQYVDKDGNLIMEGFIDYTRRNILGEFATLDDFIHRWNDADKKQALMEELQKEGIMLDVLRESLAQPDWDDFDLICHVAFNTKPLTKTQRAEAVRKSGCLDSYDESMRNVLNALLDKYMNSGIDDLENINVLRNDPFNQMGNITTLINFFGGKPKYLDAVQRLKHEIYADHSA